MEHHSEQATCRHCGLRPATSPNRKQAGVICESEAMRTLFNKVARFARSDAPVVITGESGVGKEVIARTLHANSPRAEQPFVAINAAALPAELLESELFGHARGAFSGAVQAKEGLFEAADGGTLFLDEVGELPMPLQAKLLRALQEGEIRRVGETRARRVDVRVVCATNRSLPERVREGAFREDLYYRLKVLSLMVPPLRERVDDVLPLARTFLAAEHTVAERFSPAAERTLERYGWPGNVRELQNAVVHAAALATDSVILPDLLPDEVRGEDSEGALHQPARPTGATSSLAPAPSGDWRRPLAEVEREHVQRVVEACGGAMGEAAQVLGIGRNTLWRKLQQYV